MLIRFIISNFLSFDKETELNMLPGPFKTHREHIYNLGKINVLKGTALYGANGAGKSNLVKAIEFLQDIVIKGKLPKGVNNKKFKLDPSNANKPISFEVEFVLTKKIYSYGLSIDNNTVIEEWLYESGITKEDKLIFERKYSKHKKPIIKLSEKYLKTQKSRLLVELLEENLLKNDELLLGKSEELKIKDISNANDWFKEKLIIIFPQSRFIGLVQMISSSDRFKVFANDLLETFDTGIDHLGTEDTDIDKYFGEDDEKLKEEIINDFDDETDHVIIPSESGTVIIRKEEDRYIVKKVVSYHEDIQGESILFELDEESDGTQRLLDFIPAFDVILRNDVTVIIDEIDHSLHPTLLKTLIHKVMSDSSTKGQLIFTTHESNLLDFELFRQDEIWFSEKDKGTKGTELYSLSEFKPRYDLDIRKGYLKGRFGAIPFLANLSDLNWHSIYDEEE